MRYLLTQHACCHTSCQDMCYTTLCCSNIRDKNISLLELWHNNKLLEQNQDWRHFANMAWLNWRKNIYKDKINYTSEEAVTESKCLWTEFSFSDTNIRPDLLRAKIKYQLLWHYNNFRKWWKIDGLVSLLSKQLFATVSTISLSSRL